MLHKSTKILAAVSAVFLLVSIALCVGFAFIVQKEKVQYQAMTVTLAESKSRQESLDKLTKVFEETEAERASVYSRILEEEQVIDLLALIETVGKEQGVALTTNSLTVEPVSDVFETLIINIDVEGSYASVMHVLKLLEHIPYQSSISSVTLSRIESKEGRSWKGTLEIRVTKFKKV